MAALIAYYLGRLMQIMGMVTALYALVALEPGPMFRLTGVAILEFAAGYFLVSTTGKR